MKNQILKYFTGETVPVKLGVEDEYIPFIAYKHPKNASPFDASELCSIIRPMQMHFEFWVQIQS